MDQMKKALEGSGKKSAEERLHAAAAEALTAHGTNYWLALDVFLARCDTAMIKLVPGVSDCVLRFLASQRKSKGGGQRPVDNQQTRATSAAAGDLSACENQVTRVSGRTSITKSGGKVAVASDRPTVGAQRTAFGMAARAEVIRRSILNNFPANGRPFGKLTVEEALAWAKPHRDIYEMIETLVGNQLPTVKVEDIVTGEDADRLYRKLREFKTWEKRNGVA